MEALEGNEQDRIPGPLLIALHLAPGLAFGGFFYVLARLFIQWGLTGYLALLITIPACLAPIEIGIMMLWSERVKGKRSLTAAIDYRQPGTATDYLAIPLVLFLCWGVLSIPVAPLSQYIDARLSPWLPAWATQGALINGVLNSPPAQRPITFGLAVLLSGFLAPVVEEMYFRGFLLPRMKRWGWAAPIVNVLLFAVYHFYFPGNVPAIFVAFVPITYAVMLKQNWRISFVFHSLSNLLGVFSLAALSPL